MSSEDNRPKAQKIKERLAKGQSIKQIIAEVPASLQYVKNVQAGITDSTMSTTVKMEARKEKFLKHLLECHGILSDAARKTGVGEHRAYMWRRLDPVI